MAGKTADIIGRYLSGEPLTPSENGTVGVHYRKLGQQVPKEVRAEALRRKRIGTAVAASAILAEHPPAPDPVSALAPAASASPADVRLLTDTARGILATVDGFATRRVDSVARRIGADDRSAKAFVDEARITPTGVDLIVNPIPALAAKYGVGATYAPEVSFATGLALYGAQLQGVFAKLDELEQRAIEREKRSAAAAPTPAIVTAAPAPATA